MPGMAPPGLMNYLLEQSQGQAAPDPSTGEKSFVPQPGDQRSGILAMLPAILGTVGAAVGGPRSALGNAGSGLVGGYVDQLMKQQQFDRQKKSEFENMMAKSAWDAYRDLDGVDLNAVEIPATIRQQIMDYSTKFKEAIANDGFISPKEAEMLTALHAGISPFLQKAKQATQARSTQAASRAGLMQQLEQMYPGGEADTAERSFTQLLSEHPDIQPALQVVQGMENDALPGLRTRAAEGIEKRRAAAEMAKGEYFQSPFGPVKPGEALRSSDKAADRAARMEIAQARVDAMRDIANARLEQMGKKLDAQTARIINQHLYRIRDEALLSMRGTSPEAFQEALSKIVKQAPAVSLPDGTKVPTAQLFMEHGADVEAPAITPERLRQLKQLVQEALSEKTDLPPEVQEELRGLPPEVQDQILQ